MPTMRLFSQPKKVSQGRQRKAALDAAPDLSKHTWIFLSGLHRSGTSVLYRLLRNHPDATGFTETGFPEDEGQFLQSVYPTASSLGGPGRFAFSPESHLTESSPLITNHNRELLLREWGAYLNLENQIILEKSPPNIIRTRFLQAMVPNAKFVFIIRHPVAVALATQKWAQTSVCELLLHWYLAHQTMLTDSEKLQSFIIVRYEDMINNQAEVLGEIFETCGIPEFSPERKMADHNGKYLDKWRAKYERTRKTVARAFPDVQRFFLNFGYALEGELVREPVSAVMHCNQDVQTRTKKRGF